VQNSVELTAAVHKSWCEQKKTNKKKLSDDTENNTAKWTVTIANK